MTTKELIRAEIERLIRMNQTKNGFPAGTICAIRIEAYERLLAFFDTLPDEPVTDCHDLTEEIERTYHDGSVADTHDMDHVDYENIARHFAEWQKRKMMDEAYEEEVQEVYRDDDGIHCSVSVGTDYKPGTIVYVITIPKEKEQ